MGNLFTNATVTFVGKQTVTYTFEKEGDEIGNDIGATESGTLKRVVFGTATTNQVRISGSVNTGTTIDYTYIIPTLTLSNTQ